MLFGRQKKERERQEEMLRVLSDMAARQEAEITALRDALDREKEAADAARRTIDQLAEEQRELQKALRRQMGSFEDFLDEIQDKHESINAEEIRREEARAREEALTEAVFLGAEQLQMLEKSLLEGGLSEAFRSEQKEALRGQLVMLRSERRQAYALAGVEETGTVGEPFDYRLHEALGVRETPDVQKAGTVAEVCRPGYLYAGTVKRKAQVLVWRNEDV